jgi:hypothetical protein
MFSTQSVVLILTQFYHLMAIRALDLSPVITPIIGDTNIFPGYLYRSEAIWAFKANVVGL